MSYVKDRIDLSISMRHELSIRSLTILYSPLLIIRAKRGDLKVPDLLLLNADIQIQAISLGCQIPLNNCLLLYSMLPFLTLPLYLHLHSHQE